jgi:hypothetical protein
MTNFIKPYRLVKPELLAGEKNLKNQLHQMRKNINKIILTPLAEKNFLFLKVFIHLKNLHIIQHHHFTTLQKEKIYFTALSTLGINIQKITN